MIKNIVFDLGNVILTGNAESVLKRLNINTELREEIKNKFFNNFSNLDLENETIEEHFNNSNLSSEINDEIKYFLLNYYKFRDLNKEIINLIHDLKNKNYSIYILSNNNKEAYNFVKQLPEFKCIDGWIVSCDYHLVKPNKEIYLKLFETFNLKAEECFFVDDKEKNIKAGQLLGMSGHVLDYEKDGIDELVKDLKANGVNVS